MFELLVAILSVVLVVLLWLIDSGGRVFSGSADGVAIGLDTKVLEGLSKSMSEELRAHFKELFIKKYNMRDAPPVVTVDDIDNTLEYCESMHIFKTSVHIGQRKLFITELQFFLEFIKPTDDAICIYAGAAPSNHTGYLSSLFPQIKFLLVDPNKFDVFEASPVMLRARDGPEVTDELARELVRTAYEGSEKIYIINDLFTMTLSRAIQEIIPKEKMYFVSDIRTNSAENGLMPDTLDIYWNLAQQYNWMYVMRPRQSMLKFRHPFYTDDPRIFLSMCDKEPYVADFKLAKENGVDFVGNFPQRKLVYWKGKVNIQAFPGPSSTETRLITDSTELFDWGTPNVYDSKFFYYNSIERCYCHHRNANASRELGFDHCNDCAIENMLWEDYEKQYPIIAKSRGGVKGLVKKLSDITHRPLIRENHGRFFGKYGPELAIAANAHAENPETKHLMYAKK